LLCSLGVHCQSLVNPTFTSDWLPIKAGSGSTSTVEVSHGLGGLPARVVAEVKTGVRDMITYATGSAQLDDDFDPTERYGGVVCLYNDERVRLFAPKGEGSLGGVFFSGRL